MLGFDVNGVLGFSWWPHELFTHTVNNADHEKDLKWWSNTYGVNMPMNWPQFEVCIFLFILPFFS